MRVLSADESAAIGPVVTHSASCRVPPARFERRWMKG